jgi:hypothetical protein
MTQPELNALAQRAAEAEAALRAARETAKALKAQLRAERPSQLQVVRRSIIANEAVTVDELMAALAGHGYADAKKSIVAGLRSDGLAFLRLLREMGRLVEAKADQPVQEQAHGTAAAPDPMPAPEPMPASEPAPAKGNGKRKQQIAA